MAEQNRVGHEPGGLGDQLRNRHRTEFAIDEPHVMAVIKQGPTDAEKAQWRQMIVRYSAADRGVRHIDQENAHLSIF